MALSEEMGGEGRGILPNASFVRIAEVGLKN